MKKPTQKQLEKAYKALSHFGLTPLTFGFVLNWLDREKTIADRKCKDFPPELQIIVRLAATAIKQVAVNHKAAATQLFANSQMLAKLYAAELGMAKLTLKPKRKAA